MSLNVFRGKLRPASEVFSELSNSMKLYEARELSYTDLSKHLLVILGDISESHGRLSERHLFVLSMINEAPSRDSDERYRKAIAAHCMYEEPRKIPLIKMIREEFGLGLKAAKELIEDLCEFDSELNFKNFKEDKDESEEIR